MTSRSAEDGEMLPPDAGLDKARDGVTAVAENRTQKQKQKRNTRGEKSRAQTRLDNAEAILDAAKNGLLRRSKRNRGRINDQPDDIAGSVSNEQPIVAPHSDPDWRVIMQSSTTKLHQEIDKAVDNAAGGKEGHGSDDDMSVTETTTEQSGMATKTAKQDEDKPVAASESRADSGAGNIPERDEMDVDVDGHQHELTQDRRNYEDHEGPEDQMAVDPCSDRHKSTEGDRASPIMDEQGANNLLHEDDTSGSENRNVEAIKQSDTLATKGKVALDEPVIEDNTQEEGQMQVDGENISSIPRAADSQPQAKIDDKIEEEPKSATPDNVRYPNDAITVVSGNIDPEVLQPETFRTNEPVQINIPDTVEELLNFRFQYETIDWDDEATYLPMRLLDESDDDYRYRVDLFTKESDLAEASRQMAYLGAVYSSVEEKWEAMEIRPKPGLEKMQYIKAEMAIMDKVITDLTAEFQQMKKAHDQHFEKRNSVAKEKALRMEISALREKILVAPPDELQLVRDSLVQKIAALEALVTANAGVVDLTKKKTRQRKAETKAKGTVKGLVDDDEGTPEPTATPSDAVPRTKYLTLDDEGREEMAEKGRRQINRVLSAQTEQSRQRALQAIDFSIRRAAREVQEFLPEASYLARDVARIFHYTSSRNLVCRFHGKNRGYSAHDDVVAFRGVGFPKNYSSKENGRKEPQPGHFNCGCPEDDVLMEFFIWKTVGTFSSNPSLSNERHYFDDEDVLHPKVRRLWVQQWKEATGLSVNDIYGPDSGSVFCSPRLMAISILKQIARLRQVGITLGVSYLSDFDREKFRGLLGAEEDT